MILLIVLTFTMVSRGQAAAYAFDSKITKYFAAFTVWVLCAFRLAIGVPVAWRMFSTKYSPLSFF
jgi:hypothetical protein